MTGDGLLGVAVVGLGVGEQHARAFAADSRCRVLSLYDLDAERARSLALSLPPAAVARSFEEMLATPGVDVVSIASYDDAHADQVLAALGAGKHVFVEKPLCRTYEELVRIKAAWVSAGCRLRLRSNLALRASPLFRWVRRAIGEGALGRIYSFQGDYLYGRLAKITEGWRGEVENYSVMEGGGVHLVDLLRWLAGERPFRVTATGNRIASAGTAFRYNDFVTATFEFQSGLIATINANFGCVHRHQHVVRAFGTAATFLYDDAGARLHRSRDPEERAERIDLPPLPAGKGALVPDFVDAVLSDHDDRAETQSFFDGIMACIAADRAVRSGEWEIIEEV
jgi:predicted dehydrogenase